MDRARGAHYGLRSDPWNLNRITPAEEGAARDDPMTPSHLVPRVHS